MKKPVTFFIALLNCLFLLAQTPLATESKGGVQAIGLEVENTESPMGIDVGMPVFGWRIESSFHDITQAAYEIKVFEGKKEVWNSNRVESSQSHYIPYKGAPLKSKTDYRWEVKVWDNRGDVSEPSHGRFSTAMLSASDWQAAWITSGIPSDTAEGVVPRLRKTFHVKRNVRQAKLFITSQGSYVAS